MAAEPLIGKSIAWKRVQRADLTQLLGQMFEADDCWGLVWRLDRIAWLQAQGGNALLTPTKQPHQAGQSLSCSAAELVRTYPAGRVFDAQREWRWQPEGVGVYTVLGLAEDGETLDAHWGGAATAQRTDWQVRDAVWRLTGSIVSERSDDPLAAQTWYETRYPSPLVYPVAHDSDRERQPRLEVRVYADARAAVRLVRFCRLRTEKE